MGGPGRLVGTLANPGIKVWIAACMCGHSAELKAEKFPSGTMAQAVRERLKCSRCGERKRVDLRPVWQPFPMGM